MTASESPPARRTAGGRRAGPARCQRPGRARDPASHPAPAARPGGLPRSRGRPRGGVRGQPPDPARGAQGAHHGQPRRGIEGPRGGIFVAGTADEGISRSLSDAIAVMLDDRRGEPRGAARRAPDARGPDRRAWRPPAPTPRRSRRCARPSRRTPSAEGERRATDARVHRAIAEAAATGWSSRSPTGYSRCCSRRCTSSSARRSSTRRSSTSTGPCSPRSLRGDPNRAERAMKDHLLYLRDVLQMVREREPGGGPGG